MLNERLKQFRLACGYSLDDLVEKTNGIVSKVSLSKYERGLMYPSKKVLVALAGVYNTKVLNLINIPSYKYELIAFRKNSSLGVKDRQNIENLIKIKLEDRVALQEMLFPLSVSDLPLYEYNISSAGDVEDAAARLREKWQIGSDPVSNLIDLLESRFIHVFLIDAKKEFDGISSVCFDSNNRLKTAAVASRKVEAGERQRFNLAHEIAHLVLKINPDLKEEQIAHNFAGAFLAPAEEVKKLVGVKRTNFCTEELLLYKRYFGISIQALIYRFYNLDIISESYFKQFFKMLNIRGYRKEEPAKLEPETTSFWERAVFNAYSEKRITKKEAERYLNRQLEDDGLYNAKAEFLKLTKEERAKILVSQAEDAKSIYNNPDYDDLETDEIYEY